MEKTEIAKLNLKLMKALEKSKRMFQKENNSGESFDHFFDTGGKRTLNGVTYTKENKNAFLVQQNRTFIWTMMQFEIPIAEAIKMEYPEIYNLEILFERVMENSRQTANKQIYFG